MPALLVFEPPPPPPAKTFSLGVAVDPTGGRRVESPKSVTAKVNKKDKK